MSRHTNKGKAGSRHESAQAVEIHLPASGLSVLIMLVTCMFLWPSEAAAQGDGLHLSFLWFVAASLLCFWTYQDSHNQYEEPLDRTKKAASGSSLLSPRRLVNGGLFLLIAGIWVSTWHVFQVEGDRRAALNLAFEWTAIGACACLCQTLFRSSRYRQTVITLIAGLGVGLAVFGLWKSHVVYSAEARSYQEKRQILDLDSSSAEAARIRQEFLMSEIPMEGTARELFENRLLNSTEPFGTFALANTFAGVLAVALILLFGRVLVGWQSSDQTLWDLAVPLLLVAVVGWCLILTKSRTAWVGTVVGVLAITAGSAGQSGVRRDIPKSLQRILLIAVLAAATLFACVVTGVIDRQVFLEAPRSMQFRLFYWIGAAGVIAESWIFGAGPGNFRQLYLRHKVVESSEAILDPHNILLDAWCFAGIIGLMGLLIFIAGLLRSYILSRTESPEREPIRATLVPGLMGCLVVHFGWHWLSGGTLSAEDGMLAAAIGISAVSALAINRLPWVPCAPSAAAITLLIHLLGAGGLHITITGILLVVLSCAAKPTDLAWSSHNRRLRKSVSAAGGLLSAGLAITVLFLGVIPVRSAGIYQSLGQQRLYAHDLSGALTAFNQAVNEDPISPLVRQQVVTATAYDLMNPETRGRSRHKAISAQEIEAIETACSQWIQADQTQLNSRLTRGQVWYELFRRTGDEKYATSCLNDLRQAISWHPTNARLQMELAAREDEFGSHDNAVAAAKQALKIEAVNQEWQHTDQYLTRINLQLAQRIIDGTDE